MKMLVYFLVGVAGFLFLGIEFVFRRQLKKNSGAMTKEIIGYVTVMLIVLGVSLVGLTIT